MNSLRETVALIVLVSMASLYIAEATLRGSPSDNQILPLSRQSRHRRLDKKDWGIFGSDLVDIRSNIADLWEPYDADKDTAYFFMIPKSGTTTLGTYMTKCLDLVTANRVGKMYANEKLEIVEHRGHKFVNVDVTTHEGLEHVAEVDLASAASADVIVSGMINHLATLFTPQNKLRMFTIMRPPMDRVVSEFYYIQTAEWETLQYRPWLKEWSLEQYITSDIHVDNWMVRTLVGKGSTKVELTVQDLTNAKEILARKCLIGLTNQYTESVTRFKQYFGWTDDETCFEETVSPSGTIQNANRHPTIEKGSKDYELLKEVEKWDIWLYTYATELFEEQRRLFADKTVSVI